MAILSSKKRTQIIIFFYFLWEQWEVCDLIWISTFIGLIRVSRVKTSLGKSPVLYNGEYVLVFVFNHMEIKDGPRNLLLKFGQNQVSNNWDIPDMNKCRHDKSCLDKYYHDSRNLFKMVSGTNL